MSTSNLQPGPEAQPTRTALLAILTVVLWATQLRFPPLSYPTTGLAILVLLVGLIALCTVQLWPARASAPTGKTRNPLRIDHPAILPGGLFLLWVFGRWATADFTAHGTDEVMTWMWAAGYFLLALMLTRSASASSARQTLPGVAIKMLTIAGLVCGTYAILQYHFIYHQAHDALLSSIGDRPPDRTEAALLHHLSLRRVASFLGDPNSYAAFAAIAIAASIETLTTARRCRPLWHTIAAGSIIASLWGIYYSGSRGGVLDVLLVILLLGTGWAVAARSKHKKPQLSVLLLLPLLLIMKGAPLKATADEPQAVDPQPQSVWIWRSDTIRERLYYLDVGRKMIQLNPVAGLGPGSVNDYFGRFKSPNAREARQLHNWPVNIWAEYGAVGLILVGWFVIAVLVSIWKNRHWQTPWLRAHGAIFAVILFDGLLQTSWAQRELMCLAGLSAGCLVGAAPPGPRRQRGLHTCLQIGAITLLATVLLLVDVRYLNGKNQMILASDALLAGKPAEADRHAARASIWRPRDSEPYQLRSQIALQQGRVSSAKMLLHKAIQLSPESASLNSQMATIHEQTSQPVEEEKHIQRALELYPSQPQYNLQYARFLQRQGQHKEADNFARKALKFSYLEEEQQEIERFILQLNSTPTTDEAVNGD